MEGAHASHSRSQSAHWLAALTGQAIVAAVAPRRSWMRMSLLAAVVGFATGADIGAGLSITGTKAFVDAAAARAVTFAAMAVLPRLANWRQRCTTLALMPCAIATFATDAPGASHSHKTRAWNSALQRLLLVVMSLAIVST